jgi:hypothetical protein
MSARAFVYLCARRRYELPEVKFFDPQIPDGFGQISEG